MEERIRINVGRRQLSDRTTTWLFLVPALMVVIFAVVLPLINSFYLSFHTMRLNVINYQPQFIGLENYQRMLEDPDFYVTVRNTAIFAFVSVTVECGLGLMIAMMLSGDGKAPRLLRSLMLIPMIMAPVVSGNLWRMMLDSSTGVVDYLIGSKINWLGNPNLSLFSVILVDVWRMTPWISILLISGIKAISGETIEAALVDGVSRWENFRFIIVPQLYRIFILVLMIRTIDAFKVFDLVYVMTGGGPGVSTEMLPNYIYTQGMRYFNGGYSAALAMTFLFSMALLALVFLWLRGRKKD